MAAKGFGAKSIELLGSGNATINSGNDIVLNPNSKVSVAGTFHAIGQILGYNGTAGSTDQILVSNGSGQANWSSVTDTNNPVPSSFLQLTDTPTRTNDLYTSNDAGKIVVVNNSNTALEFRAHNFLNLDDTPNSYTANTLVAIKSNISGTQKIEFIEKDTFVSTGNDINADGTVTFNYWKRFQIYHGNQITNFDAESKGDTFTILEGNGIGLSTNNQINNASLRIELDRANDDQGILMPSGSIIAWGGKHSTIPVGYLFCDGFAHSRTTYSALFAALGTIHGSGDGSTTFNVPDLRDKFIIGANTSETDDTFPGIAAGKTGGSADAIVVLHSHGHTLSPSVSVSGGNHSHGVSNDSHSHTITDPGHNHGGVLGKQRDENTQKSDQVIVDDDHTGNNRRDSEAIDSATTGINNTNAQSTGITINDSQNLTFNVSAGMSGSISNFGSDGENANLPPYYALCYIIKT